MDAEKLANIVMAADMAMTNLISLIFDLTKDSSDDTIEELKKKADEMDAKRAEVMAKIRSH